MHWCSVAARDAQVAPRVALPTYVPGMDVRAVAATWLAGARLAVLVLCDQWIEGVGDAHEDCQVYLHCYDGCDWRRHRLPVPHHFHARDIAVVDGDVFMLFASFAQQTALLLSATIASLYATHSRPPSWNARSFLLEQDHGTCDLVALCHDPMP